MARKHWTKEMDAQLSEVYTSLGLVAAVQRMGRSRSSVKNRCRTLGLKRPSRNWTLEEDAVVRSEYSSGTSIDVIARRLGRGTPAVRRRAMILGVPHGRRWTKDEIEAVKTRYKTAGAKALAGELLGTTDIHSIMLVYRLAERLKVSVPIRHPKEVYDRIRSLHAAGHNDSKIAKLLKGSFGFNGRGDRERVTAIRRRMHLPAIQMSPEERRAMGQKGRIKQIEAGENPRNKAYRLFAEKYGLPGDTPPRAVEILLALASGPKTRDDIRQMTGKDPVGLWNALGTSYLAGLCTKGFVASTKLEGAKQRGPRALYLLTSQAMDLLSKGATV